MSAFNLYWGDLHTHCNITYGHGSMEDALEAGVQHLDFCSIIAHGDWPDIPKDDPRIADNVDVHLEAFKRVRENWKQVEDLNLKYRKDGTFIPFLGYEWHNMHAGDHNVIYFDPREPIRGASSIADLRKQLKEIKAIIIPHHLGYPPGYRGYNWDTFEPSQTPFVEIYSRHGCSETDIGPFPLWHTMGPRSHEGTVQEGLDRGCKFGIHASTDHHAGYPGSYGDGRIAVYAAELTAAALWEAFQARRVYGVTGDKILVDFRINDAMMGEEISNGNARQISVRVEGDDCLDYIDIIKNGKCLKRLSGPFLPEIPAGDEIHAKIRFEWGWGREMEYTEWKGALELSDGEILNAEPCFRGPQVVSPRGVKGMPVDVETKVNRVLETGKTHWSFLSYTTKNINTLTPTTNSVVLEVRMPKTASIKAQVNGTEFQHSMAELLEGSRSHFVGGYLSDAVAFHRAIPVSGYTLEHTFSDDTAEKETDYYYVRVRQQNNQWAWTSPIWMSK